MSDLEDEEIYEDEGPGEDLDLDEETVAMEHELEDAAHLAEDLENEEGDEEEKEVEEPIPEKPLTEEMAKECLTLLSPIGKGLAHAYIRLDMRDREVTDISLLSKFIHLRYIDMTKNNVMDLKSLNNITNLLTLKADSNRLTSVALDDLPFLQSASFSRNKISSTSGVSHPMLEHLTLSFNQIHRVIDLIPERLTHLHTLELRGNKLESTAGICLPLLKNLYLAGNIIKKLEDLEHLVSLTHLHLRDNQLESLNGFSDKMKNLQYINLRGNSIASVEEAQKLAVLSNLKSIGLQENPASEDDEYKLVLIHTIPSLTRVDKDQVTDEEREEAAELMKVKEAEKQARAAEEAEKAMKAALEEEMAPED